MGATAPTGNMLPSVYMLVNPKHTETCLFSCRNRSKKNVDDWVMIYHLLLIFISGIFEASDFEAVYCCQGCTRMQSIWMAGFSEFCVHAPSYKYRILTQVSLSFRVQHGISFFYTLQLLTSWYMTVAKKLSKKVYPRLSPKKVAYKANSLQKRNWMFTKYLLKTHVTRNCSKFTLTPYIL